MSGTAHIVDDDPNITKSLHWLVQSVNLDAVIHTDSSVFFKRTRKLAV